MADFDQITYNVRGLRDFKKRRKLINYMKKHSSSQGIIFLQETHSTKKLKSFGKLSGVVKLCFHMGAMIAGVF